MLAFKLHKCRHNRVGTSLLLTLPWLQDQHGCRYLQRKLEEDPARNTDAIFVEMIEDIVPLMSGMWQTGCYTREMEKG